jgi:HAD superfamily hydrolase (TIGR01509 family)
LGDNATKEFVLRHVFEIAPELVKKPPDLLRALLRRHYRGQRIPKALDDWQRGDLTLETCASIWAASLDDATPASTGRALLESIVEAPYDGTVDLIDELHALGLVTGCLSNTNGLHWERQIRDFPALSRLRHRLASHELLLAKPEPAIYEHATSVLGLPPQRIVLFDDLAENCDGARHAGWHACQIDHEGHTAAQMRAHLTQLGVPVGSAA